MPVTDDELNRIHRIVRTSKNTIEIKWIYIEIIGEAIINPRGLKKASKIVRVGE